MAWIGVVVLVVTAAGVVGWTVLPHVELREVETWLGPCIIDSVRRGWVNFTLQNTGYFGANVTYQLFSAVPGDDLPRRAGRDNVYIAGRSEVRLEKPMVDVCSVVELSVEVVHVATVWT